VTGLDSNMKPNGKENMLIYICFSAVHQFRPIHSEYKYIKRHSDAKTQATLRDFCFPQHSYRGYGCYGTSRRVVHLVSPRVSKKCPAFIVRGINSPRFSLWTLSPLNDEGITLLWNVGKHYTNDTRDVTQHLNPLFSVKTYPLCWNTHVNKRRM